MSAHFDGERRWYNRISPPTPAVGVSCESSMFDKLAAIEERFQALEQEMAGAISDHQRMAQLGRERADLEPIVTAYRRFRAIEDQLQQALGLRESGDDGIEQLAVSGIAP